MGGGGGVSWIIVKHTSYNGHFLFKFRIFRLFSSHQSQGPCTRCQMVCVNQGTGERSKEPFMTLATYRGKKVRSFIVHIIDVTLPHCVVCARRCAIPSVFSISIFSGNYRTRN